LKVSGNLNRAVDLKKIKRLRKAKKITQEEMAAFLGYKTATGYCYLESGRCSIDAHQLYVIAKTLDVKMEELVLSLDATDLVNEF
jgi:transcriptional regulator with XRE-family HTH domain